MKIPVIIGDAAPGLYIAISGKRIAGAKPTGRIRHEWKIDSKSIQDALPKPETEYEGYPGIAHDFETALAQVSTLTDALSRAMEAAFSAGFYAGAESQGWSDADQAGCDGHIGRAHEDALAKFKDLESHALVKLPNGGAA